MGGAKVASDSRILYVQEDPPTRQTNPYTISISAENQSKPQQSRIDSGDTLGVQVNVKNNTPDGVVMAVNVTLADEIIARDEQVRAPGTPDGESARRVAAVQRNISVNPPNATAPGLSVDSIVLPPGAHRISADLFVEGNDKAVAHATKTIYVDQDPALRDGALPFDVQQGPGNQQPRWHFYTLDGEPWTLLFSPSYPLYAALSPNKDAFVEDVCAEGLVEWALHPVSTGGDETHLEELLNGTPEGVNEQTWEDFREKMERLVPTLNEPGNWSQANEKLRECAAMMLSMYRPGA